jgi:DNA-binding XRE family transcriptional regulator
MAKKTILGLKLTSPVRHNNSVLPSVIGWAVVTENDTSMGQESGKITDITQEQVLLEARNLISTFLKNRRVELNITQDTLADLSGMGIATIRRFESGKFWLNLKQYLILCHHLKCYPFIVENESEHPLAKSMREAMAQKG